jgi:hypothetical protein
LGRGEERPDLIAHLSSLFGVHGRGELHQSLSIERGSLVGSEHKSMLANADEVRDRSTLTDILLVHPPPSPYAGRSLVQSAYRYPE